MEAHDWIPAIATTTLASGALWLLRNAVVTGSTNNVEHVTFVRVQFRASGDRQHH